MEMKRVANDDLKNSKEYFGFNFYQHLMNSRCLYWAFSIL